MDQETENRLRSEINELEEKLSTLNDNSLLEDWKDGVARLGFVSRKFFNSATK